MNNLKNSRFTNQNVTNLHIKIKIVHCRSSLTGENCQPAFPFTAPENLSSTAQHIPSSHDMMTSQQNMTSSRQNMTSSQQKMTSSQQNMLSSEQNLASSQQNIASSQQNISSSQQNMTSSQQNITSSQQNMTSSCQNNETLLKPNINIIDKNPLSPGQETEISVVDDYVEVTSQSLEVVTSANVDGWYSSSSSSGEPASVGYNPTTANDMMTSSSDVMMTSPKDMIMSHMMGNPLDESEVINMVSQIYLWFVATTFASSTKVGQGICINMTWIERLSALCGTRIIEPCYS